MPAPCGYTLSVAIIAALFWLIGFLLFCRIPSVSRPGRGGSVSVIVPARNEERNLVRLLATLSAQKESPLEVIVVDDHSEDRTARVAQAARADVVSSAALPEGWTGKPWACWQGAQRARGEQLLFLDADTWLEPDAIASLAETQRQMGGLVSVQPFHQMEKGYERLGAFFNLITMIGSGAFTIAGPPEAAETAFGPCVIVSREEYFRVGGHEHAAGAVLEGFPLGHAFAGAGLGVRCLAGQGTLNFRMYPGGLREMIDGLAKGFATGAGSISTWLLIAVVAWVAGGVSTSRNLIAAALGADVDPIPWLALAGLYMGQLRWMFARVGNYGWWPAIVFPLPMAFFIGVFSLSIFRVLVRRRVSWKGRSVSTQ